MGQAASRLNIADEIEAYLDAGLNPAQMAKFLRKLVSQIRDDETATANRRAKQRVYTSRWRAKNSAPKHIKPTSPEPHVRFTKGSPEPHPESSGPPTNPLKVSRNFVSPTREDKKEIVSSFGIVDKSTIPQEAAKPHSPAEDFQEVPTGPPITGTLPKTTPAEPSALAENPRTALYDLAKRLMGKGSGGAVSKLLKLHNDDLAAVRRVLEAAGNASDAGVYVWGTIRRLENLSKQEVLDRQQIAEWRPVKPAFPPRDYNHPRQPYFVVSKVDNKKKLYLDTSRVHELVYQKADEMGVVL